MVLTKEELIKSLNQEIRVLLHLISKVDPQQLDYRPTPTQRSTLELLQYLTIVGPIHLRAVLAPQFDMDGWRAAWTTGKATAHHLGLEQIKHSIAQQPALFNELLTPEIDLRANLEMFGARNSRGSWLINLVLNHLVAYRMQLFLYLKSGGHEELSTLNLWAGVDARPKAL